ncbi:MAG TPA: glycoside hydrolase family 57 protein [Thermoleophilia bacterium]|nr:glycoside hydrolase family 57 protein [Thermoleophilia bacterium]
MNEPLDVAVVWHMHQPYYGLSDTGAFEMPWVRTHAVKDYAEMVDVLEGYPRLHQTFNLVPSLVEQLLEYATGRYVDTYQEHARRPAAELTPRERAFVLEVMCERSSHPRARRHPRYLELAQKRDRCTTGKRVRVEEFTDAELRDAQVWFDLAWFHPTHLEEGPLADLVARGGDFTEEDKDAVFAAQAALLSQVLPTYRRAAAAGRIELTTSPYFHPILPLLANSDLARVSLPEVELPTRRFDHPEDADEHIARALRFHTEVFGKTPRGMWCSEQTVGEDVIAPLSRHGIAWTISDEAVLGRSLGRALQRDAGGRLSDPDFLYSAYRLERERGAIDIVFRDRTLSDLVGFTYRDWDPGDAAADLLRRLRQARHDLDSSDAPHLVTIALDGENAWEYYRNEGRDFLERLYEGLQQDESLRCVTVSEHLDEAPPTRGIPWLHTGSWIGGDLGTWVGDRAHRSAWDLLHDARDAVARVRARTTLPASAEPTDATTPLATATAKPTDAPSRPAPVAAEPSDIDAAWREIMIAEGSDWFWWFSTHQESGLDEVWDAAFRRHLQQAYRFAGLRPPPALFAPILECAPGGAGGSLTPTVDGHLTTPDEWEQGVRLARAGGGAMQRAGGSPVLDLRFGWSNEGLFFLVVPRFPVQETPLDVVFYLGRSGGVAHGDTLRPDRPALLADAAIVATLGFVPGYRVALTLRGPGSDLSAAASFSAAPFLTAPFLTAPADGEPAPEPGAAPPGDAAVAETVRDAVAETALGDVAVGTVVEVAVPWGLFGALGTDSLLVGAELRDGDKVVDVFPSTGARAKSP